MKANEKEEQQSFENACALIKNVFLCVAYIREFFPDETFFESRYSDMILKSIRRGVNPHADRLMDWIEKGCFDALRLKYLETITLGIFTNVDNPENLIESYTLTISYPASSMHQKIFDTRAANASLKVQSNLRETTISPPQSTPFNQQIVKILRTLCIMIQTLGSLPEKKFASMQITYYDELTPNGYEPPGFEPAEFNVNFLFTKETFKHRFNSAKSAYHNIDLDLETTMHESNEKLDPSSIKVPSKCPGGIEELRDSKEIFTQETIVPDKAKTTLKENNANPKNQEVVCLCGDADSDLDMILCEVCCKWQHTPCAGFCTNKDKRIPEKYTCYQCQFANNKKLLKNLQELASFRRAISIVYSEGLESISWLSKRLSCGVAKASKLMRRLESEGLISRPNSQAKTSAYQVHKTSEAKEKIRYFFGLDLSVFPELIGFFKGKTMDSDKRTPVLGELSNLTGKRRKSMTAEKVSCN